MKAPLLFRVLLLAPLLVTACGPMNSSGDASPDGQTVRDGNTEAGNGDAAPEASNPADAAPDAAQKVTDGGSSDGGSGDASAADGASADGASTEAGPEDASSSDGGSSEAGSADGSAADSSSDDGSVADGGSEDGSAADSGSEDGSAADGGPGDASADSGSDVVLSCPTDCSSLTTACAVGVCDTSSGNCVANPAADGTSCDDGNACTSGDVCTGGVCGGASTAPAGSTCASAVVLDPTLATQTVPGDSSCAPSTDVGSCAGNGREVRYSLTLAQRTHVRLATHLSAGGLADSVLYVRSACGDASSEVLCDDDSAGSTASALDAVLDAGAYTVFVDGYHSGEGGAFDLVVDLVPVSAETCSASTEPPALAAPSLLASSSLRGDLSSASHDFDSACAGSVGGPDQVYRLDLASAATVRFDVALDGSGSVSMADPVVVLLSGSCAAGTVTASSCGVGGGGVGTASLQSSLAAGTWYVVVQAGAASGGGYSLTATALSQSASLAAQEVLDSQGDPSSADSYQTACPSGSVLVGLQGSFDAGSALAQVAPVCAPLSFAGSAPYAVQLGADQVGVVSGTGAGGTSDSAHCAAGSAVVGFDVWNSNDPAAPGVYGVVLRCAPLSVLDDGLGDLLLQVGAPAEVTLGAPDASASARVGLSSCDVDEVASGVHGAAAASNASFGLACSSAQVP